MRTLAAGDAEIIAAPTRRMAHRVQVKDSGGTFRDLTTYPGVNMIAALDWGESLDSVGIEWNATLIREQEQLSLAPLMSDSPLNRQFNPATSYAALLAVGREMKCEYLLQAEDDPRAGTWVLAFSGYIDAVEGAGTDTVKINGRGIEAPIIDCYIERERVYAFAQGANADRGCYIFQPLTAYVLDDLVISTDSKRNGHFYRVTVAGTSAATEPTWPTGSGATVVSGTVTFEERGATSISIGTPVEDVMQQLLDDNGTFPALWVPGSPGWNVRWFMVSRQPLFTELKVLADQIGWGLRARYDAGTTSMRLQFYDPNRATVTSLQTFAKAQVVSVEKCRVAIGSIRNVVQVVYSDSQDLDIAGNPKRKKVSSIDAASVTSYGRRFCEIAEASTSNIDTAAEATVLADAVLSDLAEPEAEIEVTLALLFPFLELGDLDTVSENGVHFDTDQVLAIVGYSHNVADGFASTKLQMRGKPATNDHEGWLERMTDAELEETHALTSIQNAQPLALSADTTPVGGARLSIEWHASKVPLPVTYELHLSKVSTAFVPDATTLVARSQGREFEVGNLDPARAHYAKLVPITYNAGQPVRGEPSEAITFTPGRGQATHLDPNVIWGNLPLNGGFETQLDPTAPPDFWFLTDPLQWGVDATLGTGGGISGSRYLILETMTGTDPIAIFSSEFTVNELERYTATVWRKCVAGAGLNVIFGVTWFDINHAGLTSDTEFIDLADSVGSWVKTTIATAVFPPAGARFGRIVILMNGGALGREIHIDSVELIGGMGGIPLPGTTIPSVVLTFGTSADGYTVQTAAVAIEPTGIWVMRAENLTDPTQRFESVVAAPAFTWAGGTLTIPWITGLTEGRDYRITLGLTYA